MTAAADISGDDYLKVLICSANVGNAEPTPTSFAAWVPNDGEINESLSNTDYPVGSDEITHTVGPYATNFTDASNNGGQEDLVKSLQTNQDGKFDIIVLGMQEAAFVNKTNKSKDNVNDTPTKPDAATASSPNSNDTNNGNDNNGGAAAAGAGASPKKEKSKGGFLTKGAKKAAKVGMVVRGISANQTYQREAPSDITTALTQSVDVLSYDTNKLNQLIKTRLPSYEMVTSSLRGEMRLFILAHTKLSKDITNVHVAAENTGIGSIMANKGGIIVTLTLHHVTRFSFMTCHLEAHEGLTHYNNRNKNLAEILGGAKTDPIYNMQDATIISHHMFLCGDLNYRIKFAGGKDGGGEKKEKKNNVTVVGQQINNATKKIMSFKKRVSGSSTQLGGEVEVEQEVAGVASGESVEVAGGLGGGGDEEDVSQRGGGGGEKKDEPANGSHFDQAKALVEAKDWKALNGGDELAIALKQKECLVGFSTLPCHWPPTFKVGRGEGYQYNEKRTPSYTDRILWKSAEGMTNNVIPFLYEPCPDFITSDHKPIRGAFAVKLNKAAAEDGTGSNPGNTKAIKVIGDLEQQIQIVVSDMKCTNLPIMDNELIGGLADPYVKFVSSPKELLYSNNSWPKSSIVTKNLNPVWDESYHLTLDGKGMKDGLAEGSMLMLTVVDYDATSANDVIGTVVLNLNELVSELDLSGRGPSDKVQETSISKPILRNGQEYGMLECKLKTAFLAPKEVKSFLSETKNVKTATKTSLRSKFLSGLSFS